ncbi:hypothetical protein IHQ71_06200 [Rhizobium sp. TH2]|uniref:hypothetical protein n=1 Tax=Rhizobium sp. TH2 TaxID=2775403 RepID=UPI0021588583|nr:hypothetical protein [Rhizobium sp. TH2]UVC10195.1 hypothetical protein IHQ71_06200 [Rhizobium sp. TH2]
MAGRDPKFFEFGARVDLSDQIVLSVTAVDCIVKARKKIEAGDNSKETEELLETASQAFIISHYLFTDNERVGVIWRKYGEGEIVNLAEALAPEMKEIAARAETNLTKWLTNDTSRHQSHF